MKLESNDFNVWVFRRRSTKVEYLLLHTESALQPTGICYRGLKDGLRWTREYVTGPDTPAAELRLR